MVLERSQGTRFREGVRGGLRYSLILSRTEFDLVRITRDSIDYSGPPWLASRAMACEAYSAGTYTGTPSAKLTDSYTEPAPSVASIPEARETGGYHLCLEWLDPRHFHEITLVRIGRHVDVRHI